VAFRFEPKFAVPVLIALFHDILITAGVYSLTGREVTTSTVAALLTILGYSLYDTVIVFDRVRENAPRMPRATFSQIVNRSMSEVLTRSLATSFCTMLPVTALLLFGGETLKDFAFALLVGVASGAYSSIFIASPVLTEWKEREPAYVQRRHRLIEQFGAVPAFATAVHSGAPAERGGRAAEPEEVREAVPAPAARTADGDGRRAPKPVPEVQEEAVEAVYEDGELEPDELELEDEPAAVPGGAGESADPDARKRAVDAVRAERADRKKRARQRSRRKHGRRR
jgi:SecD/SecF fusion protein